MNSKFKSENSEYGGAGRFAAGAIAGVLVLGIVAALTWWSTPSAPHSSNQSVLDQFTGQTPADQGGSGASGPADPTVASLSPAATDLIIGIGAGQHLVAVSDWDDDQFGAEDMPRIGDFDHVDWEKLAKVGPKVLITQFGDRMPAGLRQRCEQMNITVVDVQLDRIEDVYREADRLGDLLGEGNQERQAVGELQRRLAAVEKKAANLPPVRTAIAMSEGGAVGLIGPGTFHDELLTIAGGVNVAAGFGKPFVNVDQEQLMALSPDAVLDLEPDPPATPQTLRQAQRYWASLPDLAAVRNKKVFTITDSYCRRPGWRLADLAETFFQQLHGKQ
jgi:ABC-type Fe3+-hydroxamate transport system substrate-binding protein